MPDVRLTEEEEEGDLPAVCMCCGARATSWVRRNFMMQPPVVHGPSVFREIYAFRLLLATASAPRMRLRTSFCRQHRNYWKLRAALQWGGLAGLLAILFGGLALVVFLIAVVKFDAPWLAGIVLGPLVLYGAAWLIALAVVQPRSIRAQFATDGTEDIILHNVHARYVEALEQQRAQSRPARRDPAPSVLTEAIPAGRVAGPKSIRKGPLSSGGEAAAYQSIADQLTKGTSPRKVEANLIDAGWDADTAQVLVARVLEEMPGVLRSRYNWQLYTSLVLCGLLLFLTLVLSFPVLSGPFEGSSKRFLPRVWVVSILVMIGQCFWLAVSSWRVWLAHRLEKVRANWLRASGVVVGRAAPRSTLMPAAQSRSSSTDDSSALARRAIAARDTQRVQRLRLVVGGSAVVLFVLGCCCMVPLVAVVDRFMQPRDAEAVSSPSAQQQVDPNAPDPNEGPSPRGWTVLFRSDDPSIWNTDSPGKNFALPVRRAHSKIRYLRLKRLDTGEMLIVPIAHRELSREPNPPPEKGFGWCGSAKLEYGGRHLGIFQAPRTRFPNVPHNRVCLMPLGWDSYFGSGFGHLTGVDKGQFYSWKAHEIPRTVFEIAVTVDPLSEEEKRSLVK